MQTYIYSNDHDDEGDDDYDHHHHDHDDDGDDDQVVRWVDDHDDNRPSSCRLISIQMIIMEMTMILIIDFIITMIITSKVFSGHCFVKWHIENSIFSQNFTIFFFVKTFTITPLTLE